MIRFVHTADVHFGVENYGRIDNKTGIHTRLLDFEKAFNACVDYAIAEQVDFFLLCGDAYKTASPTPTQQKLLVSCLLKLYRAHIPVVLLVGNHDHPLSFGKAHALEIFGNLPIDGFYVLQKPCILKLATKSGSVQIVGIPWPTRNSIALSNKPLEGGVDSIATYMAQRMSALISHFAQQLDPATPSVLAAHCTVSSALFSGSEKRAVYGNDPILLPSQLAIEPFDYVALGHLHRHQCINKGDYPAVVYAGSIERIDFGERDEPKGFCVVTLQRKATTYRFIEINTRPFVYLEVSLQGAENHTEQVLAALATRQIHDAVVKIVYYVPEGHVDGVNVKRIQEACASALYVVGIIAIKIESQRERRVVAQMNMDLENLLTLYFRQKNSSAEKVNRLVRLANDMLEQADFERESS